jgi:DNA polymerase I-like protein with 3'-5' exonuclease and polymerase domains
MAKNQIINYPIQGSAFHCLLWSLIQIVQKELKKRKMKTIVVGQIHDSIIADVVEEELEEYLAMSNEVMTRRIIKDWPWIITPLEIEAEATPINGRWNEREEVNLGAL